MPPKRANQFFNVGVQGRKTGITLVDRGLRDEHGMEPVSGIFSSPAKPTPRVSSGRKTSGTVTTSESMDVQESTIPDITDTVRAAHLLRSGRGKFPPPLARSPMKTALGSSPRRQSSVMPRLNPPVSSSPDRVNSSPAVTRRLDFGQDDSIQETPVVNGLAGRTKKRLSVYDLEPSPVPEETAMELTVAEEVEINGDSTMFNGIQHDGYAENVGYDSGMAEQDAEEPTVDEESEVAPQSVKQPAKRGRKRKSDAIDSSNVEEPAPTRTKTKGATAGQKAATSQAPIAKPQAPAAKLRGRSKKVQGEAPEEDTTALAESILQEDETMEEASVPAPAAKTRGRLKKVQEPVREEESIQEADEAVEEIAAPAPAKRGRKRKAQAQDAVSSRKSDELTFKKPTTLVRPDPKRKAKATPAKKTTASKEQPEKDENGAYVDLYGRPLSRSPTRAPEDAQTNASTSSRYARGRTLVSVFRRTAADDAPRSRHGRPIFRPVSFWNNEKLVRDRDGTVGAIDRRVDLEPEKPAKKTRKTSKSKKSRSIEPAEELEEWEETEPGSLEGNIVEYDAATGASTEEEIDATLAWAELGIQPRDVPGAQFRYAKIMQTNFLSCGIVELPVGGEKRAKNSRRMHMVFFVASGVVEVTVHENSFSIHKGGVWQVPRGNFYSIRNQGESVSRIFFAQGCEPED
ncbi:hypothetical protein GQ43DRAFT_437029 [Delitschia confertaspora ATCC 74209]|uniref:CENP-C homolog n=1 Tax=Delitschia confertaspora ATCC 74209 TaxID=1513339 RepID=A0A9P4MZL0_9PLEO|nr:hypothetical protein GQ43DRAFT_437029 [Delitschia confertaspora ATCC 74209]